MVILTCGNAFPDAVFDSLWTPWPHKGRDRQPPTRDEARWAQDPDEVE